MPLVLNAVDENDNIGQMIVMVYQISGVGQMRKRSALASTHVKYTIASRPFLIGIVRLVSGRSTTYLETGQSGRRRCNQDVSSLSKLATTMRFSSINGAWEDPVI